MVYEKPEKQHASLQDFKLREKRTGCGVMRLPSIDYELKSWRYSELSHLNPSGKTSPVLIKKRLKYINYFFIDKDINEQCILEKYEEEIKADTKNAQVIFRIVSFDFKD